MTALITQLFKELKEVLHGTYGDRPRGNHSEHLQAASCDTVMKPTAVAPTAARTKQ